MNIDSSNILSMLSSGEGLDSIQQLLPDESIESLEFSNAMMKTLEQLQNVNIAVDGEGEVETSSFGAEKQLHEIADWISNNEIKNEFSSFIGKGLPQVKPIEKEIDLENTLETLTNVLNTIDEGIREPIKIDEKINSAIEAVKTINNELPEQAEARPLLEQIVDDFETLKTRYARTESELANIDQQENDTVKSLDSLSEKIQQVEGLLVQDSPIVKDNPTVRDNIPADELLVEIERPIAGEAVKQLFQDITEIREAISNNDVESINKSQTTSEASLKTTEQTVLFSKENSLAETVVQQIQPVKNQTPAYQQQDDSAQLDLVENTIASLVASLSELKPTEKEAVTAIYQDVKMGANKEDLGLKQPLVQKNTGLLESEIYGNSLQQSHVQNKVKQNDIDSISKPVVTKNDFELKNAETATERVLPKFATDIANLNRAILTENKAEIPPMTKHFAHPEWNKEMGERVVWMHKQAIPSAELRLNPGHLGPIKIKIDMSQDQATVVFTTQHAAVKEAIDAALPKLREMFSAQQLNLAEVSVSQQDSGQKQQRGFSQMGNGTGEGKKQADEMLENENQESSMDIADEIEAGRAIASQGVLSIFA